jgi:cell division protein FtsZ
VDFADVRTVMSEMGVAMMGTGTARGENRAREAADAAIASPLLDDIDLAGAKGVLVNVTAGMDLSISEFEEVGDAVKSFTSDNATVIVGTVIDTEMKDELRVTLVATGLSSTNPNTTWVEEKEKNESRAARQPLHKKLPSNLNQTSGHISSRKETVTEELDYLDIPAFLRRQDDERR